MSSSSQINSRPRPLVTAALSAGALVLGIPVAIAALHFAKTDMPNPVLGSKMIDTGPGKTTTLTFHVLTGPSDAVSAGAYISIITSLLVAVGLVVTRHVNTHNIWGWLVFAPGVAGVMGQIAVTASVFILRDKYPEAESKDDVPFVDGKYNTDGTLYTRESWSCMMKNFYPEREPWAEKACADLKTGNMMTIPLILFSVLLLVLSVFQIHRRGGFGLLVRKKKSVLQYEQNKGESIGLQQGC